MKATIHTGPMPTADSTAEQLLAHIVDYLDDGDQAPGHDHERPGIWDDDTDKAGQPCYWCRLWAIAKSKSRDLPIWDSVG